MSWDVNSVEILVNGNESDYEPSEGETLSQLVKRVAEHEGFQSVDVTADDTTIEQDDSDVTRNVNEFETVNISRHALVG